MSSLSASQAVIKRLQDDPAWPDYLALYHQSDSTRQLARVELTSEALYEWLSSVWSADEPCPELKERTAQLKAISTWVDYMLGQLAPDDGRLLVRAFSEKGGRRHWQMTLDGREQEAASAKLLHASASPAPAEPLEPDLLGATAFPLARQYRALGEQYTHVLKIAFGTADRSSSLYEKHVERLERQLERVESERERLHNLVIELTREEAQRNHNNQEQVVELARLQVTQQTVNQLGTAFQTYLTARMGVAPPTPALQRLFVAISHDPKLVAVLENPAVIELFENESARALIAAQISEFASMQQKSQEETK